MNIQNMQKIYPSLSSLVFRIKRAGANEIFTSAFYVWLYSLPSLKMGAVFKFFFTE